MSNFITFYLYFNPYVLPSQLYLFRPFQNIWICMWMVYWLVKMRLHKRVHLSVKYKYSFGHVLSNTTEKVLVVLSFVVFTGSWPLTYLFATI